MEQPRQMLAIFAMRSSTSSMEVTELLRLFGNPLDSALQLAFCPMAFDSKGAEWIQEDGALHNPYYGRSDAALRRVPGDRLARRTSRSFRRARDTASGCRRRAPALARQEGARAFVRRRGKPERTTMGGDLPILRREQARGVHHARRPGRFGAGRRAVRLGARRVAARSGSRRRDSRHRREPADRLHRVAGPLAAGRRRPDHLPADHGAARHPGRAHRAERVGASASRPSTSSSRTTSSSTGRAHASSRSSRRFPPARCPTTSPPTLGPDATALGQVYWYTLAGTRRARRTSCRRLGLDELRSIQDWTVRYALQAVPGVSEVASVGGYVREYQVDVDPEAMLAHEVTLGRVAKPCGRRTSTSARAPSRSTASSTSCAASASSQDVRTSRRWSSQSAITPRFACATSPGSRFGPAERRGALDDGGAEAVGGVVVVRFGDNPLAVIDRMREKIDEIAAGLPAQDARGRHASPRCTIVPFYDRTDAHRRDPRHAFAGADPADS